MHDAHLPSAFGGPSRLGWDRRLVILRAVAGSTPTATVPVETSAGVDSATARRMTGRGGSAGGNADSHAASRSFRALSLAGLAASLISQNLGAAIAKSLFPRVGVEGMTALRIGLSALLLLAFWRP